jgi:Thiamine pyrophosphate-requiring enzymes [acetolactate synthase, pyruvate dehydrogenase (cytochrome), glyoxylate carboligase, phosphonopyruvate decarboxylase]
MAEKARTGSSILLEVLRSEGVTHIFGNPGTTELPMMDALATVKDIHFVLGLQEESVVGMADGYAQATGRPAFVNLHTAGGLGNAIGALTNAQSTNVPMVVTAGQQDYRHIIADPALAGDLVGLARPVTKWAHEVRSLDEMAIVLRRAFHDAATAPAGPVFVSLPMHFMDEVSTAPIPAPSTIERRVVGGSLDQLADLLTSTKPGKLALIVGDEVTASGATEAVVAVAETLGTPVFGSPWHSANPFPTAHPLWSGALPANAVGMRTILEDFERVFLIGGRAFMTYPYTPGPALPPSVELLHLSPDPLQLGRTYATRLGIAGDPQATLTQLLPLLQDHAEVGREALRKAYAKQEITIAEKERQIRQRYNETPIPPIVAAHALLHALPPETIVMDEALCISNHLRTLHRVTQSGRYYYIRGGALGWAMPSAVGMSLGHGRQPVLCAIGDGAAMYAPQALWSAAHEQAPVIFAVVNNREYNILKNYMRQREGYNAQSGAFVGMDLVNPSINYVALAQSMGVDAALVKNANDINGVVQAALKSGKPYLIELPVSLA